MEKYKILALTDHRSHSEENSIYPLLREMLRNPRCKSIEVASRGIDENRMFFENLIGRSLYVAAVNMSFAYSPDGRCFKKNLFKVSLMEYEVVLLRLPHPAPPGFWKFLRTQYPNTLFINAPMGIEEAGSKAFLLNFPDLCPPSKICKSIEDIVSFKSQFPIVLKPVESYAGMGILKIENDWVWRAEGGDLSFDNFCKTLKDKTFEYLAVKFLKNVGHGDKRIVVCCGQVLGAALRSPAPGSWVCNVARGGKSSGAEADDDELAIIEQLTPEMEKRGIIFYGIDSLLGDNGKRVLSEINVLSIGGLPKIAEFNGRPVIQQAAKLLWGFILSKMREE